MNKTDRFAQAIYYQLADIVEISAIFSHADSLVYRARPRADTAAAKIEIKKRLEKSGFKVTFQDEQPGILIYVNKKTGFKIPRINIILFLLTLTTMFFAEVIYTGLFLDLNELKEYLSRPGIIAERLEFTIALISILIFHEFGHYFAGRRRGVLMSLPYFLPSPNFAGTFGAVIKSRSPLANRRDLIEVGAAGPIAGFVICIIVLMIGLQGANLEPISGGSGLILMSSEGEMILGNPLIINFVAWLIIGPVPDGYAVVLSPAAFAGWVGLLVTMLNLLPFGQLDGGHVIYGLAGRFQHIIARIMAAVIIGLGFWWAGWWVFGALILFVGLYHPPTLEDSKPIGWKARLIGIIAVIIFIIGFIPVPFSFGT